MLMPSVGEKPPLVTRRRPARRRAGPGSRSRMTPRSVAFRQASLRVDAVLLDARERVAADEVGAVVEADDPAEAGLVRVRRLVDVVAPERERGLEAQRVARAEAARLDAFGEELAPERAAGFGRGHDLEAVLAGVAGARDEELVLHEGQLGAGALLERGDLRAEDARQVGRRRPGPARRASRSAPGGRAARHRHRRRDERADAARVSRSAFEALPTTRKRCGIEPVDVRVVDDAAVVVAEQRVVAAAFGDRRDVVGDGAAERARGVGAGDEEAAHVRDIEDAGAARGRRCAPRRCPCTGRASPSRRRARCARPGARAGRRVGSCAGSRSGWWASCGAL